MSRPPLRKKPLLRKSPPLRKNLGQHHLRGPELCRPLVDFLRPKGERVLEIGPGGGVLSEALLDAGAELTACELDPAWAQACRRRLDGRVALWVGDALQLEWGRVPAGWLVCGNLPYNVSTVLLGRLLAFAERFPRAGFLVQLEVAKRLTAGPGDADYGALSVWTAAHVDCRVIRRVKPGSFVPPPRVDSAFVGWRPRLKPIVPVEELAELEELIYASFAHRRKTLRGSLAHRWSRDRADALLSAARLDPHCRAETLGLEEFVELHQARRAL